MLDQDLLHRLAASPLDPVVRAWALSIIVGSLSPAERRRERDRWIRAAAALVPGAAWTRARHLHAIAVDLAAALPTQPDAHTARGCIAAALLLSPGRVPALKTIGRIVGKIA